jgi:enolase
MREARAGAAPRVTASTIRRLRARQIFDSRGRPTVEVDVELDGGVTGRAAVPSGASTGKHEAHELRDGDPQVYAGLGVLEAVRNASEVIQPAVIGLDASEQLALDTRLRALDGTPRLERLGANAVLAVSMAVCRAAAEFAHLPLFHHVARLAGVAKPSLPMPMINILSGGAHARRGMDVQDFLAIPTGASSLDQALSMIAAVRAATGRLLEQEGKSVLLADEGGFSPGYESAQQALDLLVRAIEAAGLRPREDVSLGLDVAATQLSTPEGAYHLRREGRTISSTDMVSQVAEWAAHYPIVSIEDALAEDDWAGWRMLTDRLGGSVQLLGDDLFCTNADRIRRGIETGVANAVLIKLNQIGTVTDTLAAIALARGAGYRTVVSARSGETEDPFIADLAVGSAAGQIKIGSLSSSERMAKYNQLVRIQETLGLLPLGRPFPGSNPWRKLSRG